MPSKFKYLTLIFAIILICLPKPAFAIFGIGDVGLFDIFDNMLGGIEEKTGPIFTAVISVFTFYATGLGFLWLSSNFLENFISQQGQWMANLEPMTQAGWNFTAGLANMLLVLIFLAIAFAFILKIENFQAKKALPRLLLVAILINFSWVFVKMLVDITQILYNTVLPDETLFTTVMKTLLGSATSMITTVAAWILALGISWGIPIANAFAQLLFGILFTAIILPNTIIWVIQAVFFWLLASMFLSFAFLFAARVFIIQILGILSPLAFLSLILPQTKSFWSQWYKLLLEWLLLGIFLLFFLVLGFGTLRLLAPDGWKAVMIPGFSLFNFGGQIIYYFAVTIYMAVVLFIGKKFIPTGAQQLIDFAKGVAGAAVTKGVFPLGLATKRNLTNFARSQTQREEDFEKEGGFEKVIRGMSPMNRFAMRAGRWTRKRVETGYRMAGTSITASTDRELETKATEYGKRYGTDYKGAANIFGGLKNDSDKAALLAYLEKTKGGKALGRLTPAQLADGIESFAKYRPNKITDILRHMPELADEEESMKKFGSVRGKQMAGRIQNAVVSDGLTRDPVTLRYKDNDVQKLADAGTEQANLLKEAAMKKVIDDMKSADLDAVEMKLGDNKTFQKTLAKWKNDRGFIQRAIEKWGPGFGEQIQDIAEGPSGKDLESTARTNPSLLLMQTSQFGSAFMREWKDDKGKTYTNKGDLKTLVQQARTSAPTWQPIQGLPTMSPQPTDQDKNRFATYAEGTRKAPASIDEAALRDIRGAINALAYRMQESNKEIENLGNEINSATGAEKATLEQIKKETEEKNGIYALRDHQFKDQEDIIKKKLTEELQKKVRK